MKRHRKTGSYLPVRGRNSLCQTCGTNVNTEGIDFTNNQPNLVYMDKVFSFNEDTSCPLLFHLNTGGRNADDFKVELTLCSNTNSLIPCTLSPDAVFTIENSFVVVEYFNTRPPGNISPCQVTVDGEEVDSVGYANGQYTARTASVLPDVLQQRCLDRNLPTKVFFLLKEVGPWDFRARFVLEGTVNTNGRNCCFRAEIYQAPNTGNISLSPCHTSNFAIPDLSLPCSINGIAPDIVFQFDANIFLVNPRLEVVSNDRHKPPKPKDMRDHEMVVDSHHDCCPPCPPCPPPCPPCPESLSVALISNLAIEPTVHVETIRKTLFCVNACEAIQPCQGNVVAAEEEEEEACDLFAPDCSCGPRRPSDVAGERDRDRGQCNNNWRDFRNSCGGFNVEGLTVGTGNCDDCENVRGTRDRDHVRGSRDNRFCKDRILSEICEDLLGESTCDCEGDSVRGARTCDCEGDSVRGARTRTAFQFNGCNGCSW